MSTDTPGLVVVRSRHHAKAIAGLLKEFFPDWKIGIPGESFIGRRFNRIVSLVCSKEAPLEWWEELHCRLPPEHKVEWLT